MNKNIKNIALSTCGWLLLSLAFAAVFIPVLPTTPLVLLAAVCFSSGNPKMSQGLEKSYVFGPYIVAWRTKQGISKERKIAAIFVLWLMLLISMVMVRKIWLVVFLTLVGIGVTIHLVMLKTAVKPNNGYEGSEEI
ncbi:inner membrane protein YbaN [Oxobacter pfennigii]|uniref:Inner membrane protein YbaN n=1 Tax=Oxobacter pfennigii TaxID=36849 RepID=A0A0P8W6C3_9CLOT|nr:YbaN family protein [Oxobacter pfennigii]KPU43550.1 inner membrane protein YbaN [Oxobacter pfennigii]